ncbi:hypothetical protein C2845_PM09G05930 [Panicum miliaceum]|uniref:Uncharacterized protein n=1 Tax=Panicum miliaceum TaxID=4540 RepID=A0A3L6S125_PANMI|nr:hypothetical protein C2845_PM09G05930 [Panicum miliaceum]
MAGAVPGIIVLALGAGALGGADALRLLLAVAGRNPVADIGICLFVLAVATAQLLGAVLLTRFVRKAPAGAGAGRRGAPGAGADPLARITLMLSLAAASLVAACLVVAPGGLGSARLLADSAAKYYPVVLVVIGAGAGAYLFLDMLLFRLFRERRNARGRAAPAERAATARHAARFLGLPHLVAAAAAAAVVALLAAPFCARGGLDALRLSPGFANLPVAVAVAIAVGATLLVVRFPARRATMSPPSVAAATLPLHPPPRQADAPSSRSVHPRLNPPRHPPYRHGESLDENWLSSRQQLASVSVGQLNFLLFLRADGAGTIGTSASEKDVRRSRSLKPAPAWIRDNDCSGVSGSACGLCLARLLHILCPLTWDRSPDQNQTRISKRSIADHTVYAQQSQDFVAAFGEEEEASAWLVWKEEVMANGSEVAQGVEEHKIAYRAAATHSAEREWHRDPSFVVTTLGK